MAGLEDRRRTVRTQVLLKVDYVSPADIQADYLTDVGEGGLFIRTDAPFEVGLQISFTLSFPGLLEPLDLRGTVRWRREAGEDKAEEPAGVGVEFVYENDEQRQKIKSLVGSIQHAGTRTREASHPFIVLLVEDNEFVHEMFRHALQKFHRQLENAGQLEVISVKDGQEALMHIKNTRIDMAIVDHFLPAVTGAELIRRIRAEPRLRDIPILAISVGGEGVREGALTAGADLYLDKPVLLKQLLVTLRLLVTKREFVKALLG